MTRIVSTAFSPGKPSYSVEGELARETDIGVQRPIDGLPSPIVADTVRPRSGGTGNGPLHSAPRAGQAVTPRPRVRCLPVPVVGYHRPCAIGVLVLDLQE